MRRSNLKIETFVLIWAAQDQALSTNYMNCKLNSTINSYKCKICASEYKSCPDNVARIIHWKLWKPRPMKGKHKIWANSNGITENDNSRIEWDVIIYCNQSHDGTSETGYCYDELERKNIHDNRYNMSLWWDQCKRRNLKQLRRFKVGITKVVVSEKCRWDSSSNWWLGRSSTQLKKIRLKKISSCAKVEHLQKLALLGTVKRFCSVLEIWPIKKVSPLSAGCGTADTFYHTQPFTL